MVCVVVVVVIVVDVIIVTSIVIAAVAQSQFLQCLICKKYLYEICVYNC